MVARDEAAPHVAGPRQLAAGEEVAIGTRPTSDIPGREASERIRRVVVYVVLLGLALLYFIPFIWSLLTSLKTVQEVVAGFDVWPDNPSVKAYRRVWSEYDFVTYYKNSFIFAASITAVNLFLSSLGGYAFARLRFPGREIIFIFVLGTLMIPDPLRLVPVYLMLIDFPVTHWNLVGSYRGFIFFGSTLALATNLFLLRQYFLTIPKDYEEAAKLDGAGYFKTYYRVMLPLAVPAVAAVAILTFQGTWNEFFWALIVLGFDNPELFTVQLGLTQFQFQYQTLWPELMAATTIAILPIVVVYIFFQRFFVAGITAAGVKG
jgi:multiple sugar transport system permease protein